MLLLYLLREPLGKIFALLLLSSTLAYLFCPIAAALERKCGVSPRLSALLSLLIVTLLLGAVFFFGIPAFGRQMRQFSQSLPELLGNGQKLVERASKRLLKLGFSAAWVENLKARFFTFTSNLAERAFEGVSGFVEGIKTKGYLLLSPVVAFFLIKDRKPLFSALLKVVPLKIRRETMKVALSVQSALGAYVRGQVLVSFLTGCLTSVGLFAIGMPFALVLGLLMAVFDLIPYFGPWLGAIPIVLLALPKGIPFTLLAALVVFVVQQAEALLLAPNILGDAAELHPCIVLLALLSGSFLWGLPGMLYAIPLFLVLRACFITVRENRLQTLENRARVH